MSEFAENIKYLVSNRPEVSVAEAMQLASRIFGLEGEFTPCKSDRDTNFAITGENGRWILKYFHPEEDPGVIDFQTRALLHIAKADGALQIPEVVPTTSGELSRNVTLRDGRTSIVRVLSWLPGTPVGETEYTRRTLRGVGALVARTDRALRGFVHPSSMHTLVWDIRQAPTLRVHTGLFENRTLRQCIETVLDRFIEGTLPRLETMRSQVIHNDANSSNVLVDENDPETPVSIIDFGDMIHGPLAVELALACDDYGHEFDDPLSMFENVAVGFDSVIPLEEEEVDVLYDCIVARLAISGVITLSRFHVGRAGRSHDELYLEQITKDLERLESIGPERATQRFREVLRMPTRCRIGTTTTPEADDTEHVLGRRHRVVGKHLSLFYEKPIHVERGRGAWLYDANGRAFLDAYNNVPSVGHCHPHVVNAIARQTAALGTNTRYLYDNLAAYAERLLATMPAELDRCVFVNSGSEANDMAFRMANVLTGNRGCLIVKDAYHGITDAIAHLSPEHSSNLAPHVRALVAPDPYRGPYREDEPDLAGKYASFADQAIAELESTGMGTALFMIDTSFCSNGIPDVPPTYLGEVFARVKRAGGMNVADEVQFGFARPGRTMWGFEYYGVTPDFVTLGKPVGGGYPLGVVVTRSEILSEFNEATDGLFSTFGGNPVACAAGLAVLDVIEREELQSNARETGDYLKNEMKKLLDQHDCIGDVRGCGLIAGVEFVHDRRARTPAPEITHRVQNRMRELGVLVGREGPHGNVFKIRPPLVFDKANADMFVAIMNQAVSEL